MKKSFVILLLIFSAIVFTCCTKNNEKTIAHKEVNQETNNTKPNTLPSTLNNENTSIQISISNVDFLSSKMGYMNLCYSKESNGSVDTSFKILKTQDGGYHWTSVGNNNLIELTMFIDDKLGYGEQYNNGNLQIVWMKTMDGGLSWSPIEFIKDKNTLWIDILDKNTMFICTTSNKQESEVCSPLQFYKTVNGGKTWVSIAAPSDAWPSELGGMSWISLKKGYVLYDYTVGAGNQAKTLYCTEDGGKTWSIKSKADLSNMNSQKVDNSIGLGGYCSEIKFFTNNVGYLGLSRGTIRKTTDGGITFRNITEYSELHPLPSFVNSEEGYAIFESPDFSHMTLNHTTDGGEHWERIISANIDLWNK